MPELSDFDYALPAERIAQAPPARRTDARMMVVDRASGRIAHETVKALPGHLRQGDLLVVNDSRVIPARLFARKTATGGRVELLLVEEIRPGLWDALVRSSRPPKPGTELSLFGSEVRVRVDAVHGGGRARVVFDCDDVYGVLERSGVPPVPPYIKRAAADPRIASDRDRYQTVYAAHRGSIAAPTAGLHFTGDLLRAVAERGVLRASVTLHVGPGTFKPVTCSNVAAHVMEAERYSISRDAARAINAAARARSACDRGARVVAVGTTTVRVLETAAAENGRVRAGGGRSSLFVYPPYAFRLVDALLTNFHLPRSTLLMMVCAFAGRDLILHAYEEAIRKAYRFYSYGDCMLIV